MIKLKPKVTHFISFYTILALLLHFGYSSTNIDIKLQNLQYEISSGATLVEMSPKITVNFKTEASQDYYVGFLAVIDVPNCQIIQSKNSNFTAKTVLISVLHCKYNSSKPIVADLTIKFFCLASMEQIKNQTQSKKNISQLIISQERQMLISQIKITIKLQTRFWILGVCLLLFILLILVIIIQRRRHLKQMKQIVQIVEQPLPMNMDMDVNMNVDGNMNMNISENQTQTFVFSQQSKQSKMMEQTKQSGQPKLFRQSLQSKQSKLLKQSGQSQQGREPLLK